VRFKTVRDSCRLALLNAASDGPLTGYPPLTWQTYDIDFTAARYDAAGQKTKLGRCTVKFNGVTILDDVEIKGSTPGGIAESPDPAGIYLQAHGHPVFFKNIWILEKK
jgi:hypothetical protein